MLFLKPENYGVTHLNDVIAHGFEYIVSLLKRKGVLNSAPEKGKVHRKERTAYIDPEIKNACQACMEHIASDKFPTVMDDSDEFIMVVEPIEYMKEKFDKEGITYLTKLLESKGGSKATEETKNILGNFWNVLEQHNLDHHAIRTAQEVIFFQNELVGDINIPAENSVNR